MYLTHMSFPQEQENHRELFRLTETYISKPLCTHSSLQQFKCLFIEQHEGLCHEAAKSIWKKQDGRKYLQLGSARCAES